jgi:hypothetical protein
MANILTAAEAAYFVRTYSTDPILLQLMPLVDKHIERATGRDWTADATKSDLAKAAAGAILTAWYDNPQMVGQSPDGALGALTQLEAEAAKYRKYTFRGLSGAGSISLPEARIGDAVIKLQGYSGVSGDQSSHFASTVTVNYSLSQTDSADLSNNYYVVILKSAAEDIRP